MGTQQPARLAPLLFGCPIRFTDRAQGRLVAVEVDDTWEVLNIVIQKGVLWSTRSVKLAFSTATSWSTDAIKISATSEQVFAREIPPVAAPARQLSASTPLSPSGAQLMGFLVELTRRRADEAVLSLSGNNHRSPVTALSYDGITLHLVGSRDQLPTYRSDTELAEAAHFALNNVRLTADERSLVSLDVIDGAISAHGNVRTKQTTDLMKAALARVDGAAEVRIALADDLSLEFAIGAALERAGLTQSSEVYARSVLGEVTLFGRASSALIVDDITRVVSQLPGVRRVTSRMTIGQSSSELRSNAI
jgi:osmotically-inducible protein OsmY